MRRITVALLGTLSSMVLLFAYPTSHGAASSGAAPAAAAGEDDAEAGAAAADPSPSSAGTAGATSAGTGGGTSSGAAKTYTGSAVGTRWGTVQVRITVKGGRLTAVKALQYPNDNGHSQGINDYALPILAQEAVAAQSASIDAVSGATVTSGGYTESLQSALDAAHL